MPVGMAESMPSMLAAWPMLEKLSIPWLILSPVIIQAAARTYPHLESVTALCLSEGFACATLPAALPPQNQDGSFRHDAPEQSRNGYSLKELRLSCPSRTANPEGVIRVARFLCAL
ncbi:hypothetical protein DAEQUDRAFT_559453 [Daedalea quercina L-15889]|uniref:Uncharacterized protein n=1 Tax=Daedalea quercina L-15889 TaxID=1314783 RepID=A0A165M0A2_9APHY|nr:hypothetical protein DAEQUDRAFT_559453 [Daedalea quercina L-15889]